MTAEVHGHQPVVIRQVRTELTAPAQGALGETVDKQDRLPVRISRFQDVQTRSSAAGDVFTFHRVPQARLGPVSGENHIAARPPFQRGTC